MSQNKQHEQQPQQQQPIQRDNRPKTDDVTNTKGF